MDKRVRSPNYPALSLPDAIEKATAVYRNLHTHAAPREVVVKSMGYNSLNGASATAVSAVGKYGLLERVGDELKVSERALRILHPHSQTERAEAIRSAATEPALFNELAERFPGRLPNEELLRNYLVRKGFAPSAVGAVILAYRETSEFVDREAGGYDSGAEATSPEPMTMTPDTARPTAPATPVSFQQNPLAVQDDERPIGRYDFEGGGYVRIVAGGDIETEEALEMVETLITLKRKEIERKRKAGATEGVAKSDSGPAKSGEDDDPFA